MYGNRKIKAIAKKSGEDSDCALRVLQHDEGCVVLFENKEKELLLDAYLGKILAYLLLAFTSLMNIEPVETFVSGETGKKCWHVILKPGEHKYFKTKRKDFIFKFGISRKSAYKLLRPGEDARDFK